LSVTVPVEHTTTFAASFSAVERFIPTVRDPLLPSRPLSTEYFAVASSSATHPKAHLMRAEKSRTHAAIKQKNCRISRARKSSGRRDDVVLFVAIIPPLFVAFFSWQIFPPKASSSCRTEDSTPWSDRILREASLSSTAPQMILSSWLRRSLSAAAEPETTELIGNKKSEELLTAFPTTSPAANSRKWLNDEDDSANSSQEFILLRFLRNCRPFGQPVAAAVPSARRE
jgi:hypothetical protein